MKGNFKIGQYYASKYKGSNGDLILGRIESVRTNGHIQLTNMLTGASSFKKASILGTRNKRISKAQADKLVTLWKKTKSKAQVRALAVEMPPFGTRAKKHKVEKEAVVVPVQETTWEDAISEYLPRIAASLQRIAELLEDKNKEKK